MTNLVTLWKNAKTLLEQNGIESPTIDARILLIAATNVTRNEIVTDPYREIDLKSEVNLNKMLERRIMREPVAHIIGKKAFWSLELNCDARALVPRPETEVIVDFILKYDKENTQNRVLDLGTGTGAIILALLAERTNWTGLGIDISDDALSLANENAQIHGLATRAKFQKGNWANEITEEFDFVVSNPPYIPTSDLAKLDKDVRDFDPHLALDGGEDGLLPYRILFEQLPMVLKSGGLFAFEFGINQGDAIRQMVQSINQLHEIHILKDLSNKERVIIGKKR